MSFVLRELPLNERAEIVERARDAIGRHRGRGILTMLEAVDIAREEMVDDRLDTVALCEDYLANAEQLRGVPTGMIFEASAIEFSRAQIVFEKASIARLEGGGS